MDQRVTLLEKSVTRDALGGEVIAWTDRGNVWAEVTPLRGREYFAAQQINPEYSTRFRIHYDDAPTITSAWRLEWRSAQYDIIDVIDVDARKRTFEIMTRTAPN